MTTPPRPARTGFLLSQLGTLASERFAELVKPLGLTPSTAGVLRIVGREAELSQRELATRLRAVPSRVVVLVDSLEADGLIVRQRDRTDRRQYRLSLTDRGRTTLAAIRGAAEQQNADILAPLDEAEREALEELLKKLADQHGLDATVHTGYRDAGSEPGPARRQR